MAQRNILKIIKSLCWWLELYGFEIEAFSKSHQQQVSKARFVIILFMSGVFIISECCAVALLDLDHEHLMRGGVYTIAHVAIMVKFTSIFWNNNGLNQLIDLLFMELPGIKATPQFNEEADKRAFRNTVLFMSFMIIGTLSVLLLDGITAYYSGVHWNPLVLWVPGSGKISDWVQIAMIPLCYIPMFAFYSTVEILTVLILVYMDIRFKEISRWLQGLKRTEHFKSDLQEVVQLHNITLKCAKQAQDVFAVIYSMQVLQSTAMLSLTVVEFLNTSRDIGITVKTIFVMIALLFNLGQYTWSAGDVTASSIAVSDAAGTCDWASCDKETRTALVLIAMRAQKPLHFKAFGYFDMSHNMFVTIVNRAYSIIALLY